MSTWRTHKISDFLKPYRIEHIIQDSKTYKQVTISKSGNISLRGELVGAKIGRKRQFKIDLNQYPNTVLFTRQGLLDGAIGVAPTIVDNCVVTENMPMMSVNTNIISIEYLKKLLISDYLFEKIRKLKVVGSAQKSIHERDLIKIEVELPPIHVQEIICKKFKVLDSEQQQLSSELTYQKNLLKKLRQQILQEAIEGKLTADWRAANPNVEPASELLKRIAAEKEQLVKDKKIKPQKPLPPISKNDKAFNLPENWEWCHFQDITRLITDGKHGDCQNLPNSGYYFLSAKDIQGGNLIYCNARQIVQGEFQEVHNRTNLEPGDICMVNTGATVGKTAIAPDHPLTYKTTFQKSVAVIKIVKPFIDQSYIKFLLVCETSQLFATSWGSAINNLLLGDLKKLLVPLPPLLEQKAIVTKVEKLFALCDQLETQISQNQNHAEQLMQAVLTEAFGQSAKSLSKANLLAEADA